MIDPDTDTFHNKLLENFKTLASDRRWFLGLHASYLSERSQFTKFGNEVSNLEYVKGGVPQGSKLGPIAFIVHINNLPSAVKPKDLQPVLCNASNDQVIIDEGTALFMNDTTLFEAIETNHHISGKQIGNSQSNIKVAPYSFLKSGQHMFQTENLVH